jgi:hypothetical protein
MISSALKLTFKA